MDTIEREHHLFVQLSNASGGGGQILSRAGFMRHPSLKHNPLRERVATAFYGSSDVTLEFTLRQYVLAMAEFSTAAPRESRMRRIFALWDVDADGRIGLGDLLWILSRTVAFDGTASIELGAEADPVLLSGGALGEQTAAAPKQTKLRAVAELVLAESSSHPDKAFLSMEDFFRSTAGVEAMGVKSALCVEVDP
jgi:hypothetical protein